MNQHQTIINALQDHQNHCSNELRDLYVPEYRSRINELRKRGYVIVKERCKLHHHKGISQMWKLVSEPSQTPTAYETILSIAENIDKLANRAEDLRRLEIFSGRCCVWNGKNGLHASNCLKVEVKEARLW